jgi:hypothetical protein
MNLASEDLLLYLSTQQLLQSLLRMTEARLWRELQAELTPLNFHYMRVRIYTTKQAFFYWNCAATPI